jgi:hypothetical protein
MAAAERQGRSADEQMRAQQTDLAKRLERDGWVVVDRQRGADWWADEVWSIQSTWHPRGYRLWITFLIDPMHDGPRAPGEHVWAVGVTESQPMGPEEVTPTAVPIRHGWLSHLETLTAQISGLRDVRARHGKGFDDDQEA